MSHACTVFLPVEPCRLQVYWRIRTQALIYWLDCNYPLLCQVALVLNTGPSMFVSLTALSTAHVLVIFFAITFFDTRIGSTSCYVWSLNSRGPHLICAGMPKVPNYRVSDAHAASAVVGGVPVVDHIDVVRCLPLCGALGLRWGAEATRLCVCLRWFSALVPAFVFRPTTASLSNMQSPNHSLDHLPNCKIGLTHNRKHGQAQERITKRSNRQPQNPPLSPVRAPWVVSCSCSCLCLPAHVQCLVVAHITGGSGHLQAQRPHRYC